MSITAIAWAWRQDHITSTQKLTLLALADCYNEARNQCNPSIAYLVKKTCADRKTVISAIAKLTELGLIVPDKHFGRSSHYHLSIETSTNSGTGTTLGTSTKSGTTTSTKSGTTTSTKSGTTETVIGNSNLKQESTRAGARTTHPQNNDNSHIEPKVKPKPKNTRKKPEQIDPMLATLPDAVDPQAWADWVGHKAETKKPMRTQGVITKTANLLASFTPEQQRRMVDYSIVGGYPGLYENQAISNGSTKNEQNDIVTAAIENFSFAEIRRRGTTNPLYRA